MLKKILKKCINLLKPKKSTIDYWKQRVNETGKRSVLNSGHPAEKYEEVTEWQKKEIFPSLKEALNGNEKVILDFGCGPGRFTGDLASLIKGKAIGIDPMQGLIDVAPKSENVEYKVFDGKHIPLPSFSVDAVFICLVLGGIKDNALDGVINEIRRVLKKGGLVFLVENTTIAPDSEYWSFRGVKEYSQLFYIDFKNPHKYLDLKEHISIMVGRI